MPAPDRMSRRMVNDQAAQWAAIARSNLNRGHDLGSILTLMGKSVAALKERIHCEASLTDSYQQPAASA